MVNKDLSEVELNDCDVLLVDKMGPLAELYALADIAIVGGSFFIGAKGHNMLEAIAMNVPTLCGNNVKNWEGVFHEIMKSGSVVQCSRDELFDIIDKTRQTSFYTTKVGDTRELLHRLAKEARRNIDIAKNVIMSKLG